MTEIQEVEAHFGRRLQEMRQAKGLTLREVEQLSNGVVRHSHLSQIERGKIFEPSLSVLRALADVFNLSLGSFLAVLGFLEEEAATGEHLSNEELLLMSFVRDMSPAELEQATKYLKFMYTTD